MPPAASDTQICNGERNPPRVVEPKLADFRWNLDVFNRAHRLWLVNTAPADLTTMPDCDLVSLNDACGASWYDAVNVTDIEHLHRRVLAERTRRGLNTAFTTAKAGERAA